jgi:hypothetical protein
VLAWHRGAGRDFGGHVGRAVGLAVSIAFESSKGGWSPLVICQNGSCTPVLTAREARHIEVEAERAAARRLDQGTLHLEGMARHIPRVLHPCVEEGLLRIRFATFRAWVGTSGAVQTSEDHECWVQLSGDAAQDACSFLVLVNSLGDEG